MIYAALILLAALLGHLRGIVLDTPRRRGRPHITLPPASPTGVLPGWAVIDPTRVTRFR